MEQARTVFCEKDKTQNICFLKTILLALAEFGNFHGRRGKS